MSYELTVAPAEEPLTLTEAKAHLRIDHADEDTGIEALITLARRKIEHDALVQLVTATWNLYRDHFPTWHFQHSLRVIEITKPPLQQVNSVQYYDVDAALQTFDAANYYVDAISRPGRITLKNGQVWPTVEWDRPHAVIVNFDAGYGTAADVPEEAKHAMRLLVGHWYENREAAAAGSVREIEFSYESLLEQLQWTAHHKIIEPCPPAKNATGSRSSA